MSSAKSNDSNGDSDNGVSAAAAAANIAGEEGSNLIVNYVPTSLTDEGLNALFKPFGIITHCKIVRDRATGASLGYGFVKYQTAESARQAIEKMNGYQLDHKILRVSVARPPNRSLARVNVYVAGLPPEVTVEQVRAMFSQFGAPRDVKLLKDPSSGAPRGVAFVMMDTHEHATNAIRALDKTTIPVADGKRTINVRFANPRRIQQMVGNQGNAFGMTGFGTMRSGSHMPRFNPMYAVYDSYRMGTNPNMNMGSGVLPSNPAVPAQHSGSNFAYDSEYDYDRQMQNVMRAHGNSSSTGVCLFVYNIPPDMQEHALAHLFSACGTVLSSKVMRDLRTGLSKGFGFVNMLDAQQAQMAITTLNGYKIGNKTISVSLKTTGKVKGM